MLRFFILTICFLFSVETFSQTQKSSEDCLAIVGIFSNPQIIKGIKAYLYQDEDIVDSATVDTNKDFGFILKRNRHYTVQIAKDGFYPRRVSIVTDLPDKVKATPLFIFEFEIKLLRQLKGVDDFYMDFPIALIAYDKKIDKFLYSKKYTLNMQDKLKKTEEEFKVRKSH